MKIEEAQLIDDGDAEDSNKMFITSFKFTDLLTLSSSENINSLMQIHNHICQSLNEVLNAKQNILDRTTYNIQFNQDQELYIFICCGSKFLD